MLHFTIESRDDKNNHITIKPKSCFFKNPIDSYESINIDLSTLDPNIDINEQIDNIVKPMVINILKKEGHLPVDFDFKFIN